MSPHDYYVAAAYGISALALAATIGWIVLDQQARRREFTELEAQGVRRRSDREKP
ncbi:heme exporter protein CcmD [Arvimicrobium flavum]|uniref:heme exporter protein CcmD n=1 Tax=Arvimicrobium flavum TaxID=3393320 RepID=UPI00237B247B|nr:heme exporter protein CcmD [Mesorhizobium shangrilense]